VTARAGSKASARANAGSRSGSKASPKSGSKASPKSGSKASVKTAARATPRGGGRRMPSGERRAQIVKAVIAAFAERGLAGTTSLALARACGVSEALLFRLFGDKRGLYAAMIEYVVERGRGAFPEAAARARDDLQVFVQIAESLLVRSAEDPSFLRLLLHSALEGHEFMAMFHEARSLKVVGFLTRYIRTRIREGAFRKVDAQLVAIGFLGMVNQLPMARLIFRMPDVPDRAPAVAARAFAELTVRGLRAGQQLRAL
jgi:AcrR family transcriptional regulator